MQIIPITRTTRCMIAENFVSFFITNTLIPLMVNRMTFSIDKTKTDKTSKFGVHGPDLNFPETFIATTINIAIT